MRAKGVKRYKSKGRWFTYHRATGARIRAEYGSAAFFLEVARLDSKAKTSTPTATLETAIDAYRASRFYLELAPATRQSYERAFAEMKPCEALPLVDLSTHEIVEARDLVFARRGRWMADYFVTVLGIVLDFSRERGWIRDNPAKGIRRIPKDRNKPRANRPWTWQECRTVLDAAPPYLAVPIALAMLAGFRKGDVLTLPRLAIRGSTIVHCTSKRGVDVAFPIHPTLANVLALAPAHEAPTIAANSRGEPWTTSGYNSTFGKLITKLENDGKVAAGLTMHGLRHTVGTRLIEAGASIGLVRRLLGQRSVAMAQLYSELADVGVEASAVVGRIKVVEGKEAKSG